MFRKGLSFQYLKELRNKGDKVIEMAEQKSDDKTMKYLAIAIVAVLVLAAVGFVAIVASKRNAKGLGNDPDFSNIVNSAGQQLHDMNLDKNKDSKMDYSSTSDNAPKSTVTPKLDPNGDGNPEFDDKTMQVYTSSDPEQESKKYSSTWKGGQMSDVDMPQQRAQWSDSSYHNDEYDSSVKVDDRGVGSEDPVAQGVPTAQPSIDSGINLDAKDQILPIQGLDDKNGLEGTTGAWMEPPTAAQKAGNDHKLTRYVNMGNLEQTNNTYCKDPSGKWKWTEYTEAKDNNKDGKIDWAMLQCIGTYSQDNNSDGNPEYSATVALEIQVWDNESNNKINVFEAKIGAEEKADPNSDGKVEYLGLGAWTIELKDDSPNDGNFDSARATLRASQTVDIDTDGNIDFERDVYAHLEASDANSNAKPEYAFIELDVFQEFSINDDKNYNYAGRLNIKLEMKDPTDDGKFDSFTVTFWGYEILDQNMDGNPELGRGIAAIFMATDANSDGVAEKAEAKLGAFAFEDSNSNGIAEKAGVILLNLTAEEVGQGKEQPKYLKIEMFGFIGTDLNEDKNPDMIRAAYVCAELKDTDSSGKWDEGRLVAAGYMLDDNNSDGKPEKEGVAAGIIEATDKNSDGKPEHAALALWGFAYTDPNSDGVHESEHAFVAAFEANDTNSDGHPEEVRAGLAGWVGYDTNSDGYFEHQGILIAGAKATDANSDGNPEHTNEWIVAGESLDANGDKNPELLKAFAVQRDLYDNNSNGVRELNVTKAGYYEMHDNNSDGQANYICVKLGEFRGEDANEDGTYEKQTIQYWEYIWGSP